MKGAFLSILVFAGILFLVQGCRAINSTGDEALFNKGMDYFYSGDFSSAELVLKKINPGSEFYKRALIVRARSLFLLNRDEEAVGILKDTLKKYPGYSDAIYWAGKVNFFNGNFKKAEEYLLKYVDLNSSDAADCLYILGEINRSRKDYDRAFVYFNEVEQYFNLIALSKLRKAQIFLDSGQKEKAKREIDFVKRNSSALNEGVRSLFVKMVSKYDM